MPHCDVSSAVGSRELLQPLIRLGLPARLRPLQFGDFAWYGHGPDGTVRVGVERKKVDELVGEVSRRRFVSHQLPGLVKRYAYRFVIVEGLTRVGAQGELLHGRDIVSKRGQSMTLWFDTWGRGYTWERWVKEQMTVRLKGAVHFLQSGSASETAFLLHAMYRWWQKDWAEHKSAFAVEEAVPDSVLLDERTWRRQVFAQFPGVGWQRSARVSRYFPSVHAGVTATDEDWMQALGVEKGRKRARTIVNWLHGKGEGHAKA